MTDTDWPDFEDVIDPDAVPVPGSRPRVKHIKRAETAQRITVEVPWDAYPKIYRVDGVDTELFGVNALAKALGRKTASIKHWEREGWLPKTNLRSPMELRSGLTGRPTGGRRLYTRAFIEGIIRLANEEGVMAHGTAVGETNFPQRAHDLYYDTMPGEPA